MAERYDPQHRADHPFAGVLVALLLLITGVAGWFRRGRRREPAVSEEALEVGHETSDMQVGFVITCMIALIVVGAIVGVVTAALDFSHLGAVPDLRPVPGQLDDLATPAVVAPPVLETTRGQGIDQLRVQEDAALHSYGWVDRSAGTVRIPIERAMDLVAARGLPSRPAGAGQTFRDDGASAPSVASSGRVMEPADRW